MHPAATLAIGLLSPALAGCLFPQSDPPVGLALIRVSEVNGVCPLEYDSIYALTRIPTDLPYRRARATASFRASTRYAGGHYISVGYEDDDGRIGLVQYELPAERGYGIAEYPDPMLVQAAGFAEWSADGALEFAGRTVAGYFNYLSGDEHTSQLPGKIYSLVAFDGKDARGADHCRIVAVHASAERERVTPFDPSWLVPRPGLLALAENDMVVPAALDDLSTPTNVQVLPADAPADPGDPAPPLTVRRPIQFADPTWGSSSPCD